MCEVFFVKKFPSYIVGVNSSLSNRPLWSTPTYLTLPEFLLQCMKLFHKNVRKFWENIIKILLLIHLSIGIGLLTGTPSNLVVKKTMEDFGPPPVITYGTWATFGVPLSIINLLIAWICLCAYLPNSK